MPFTRAVFDLRPIAEGFHRRLPARIRAYLTEVRGLSEEVVDRFLLGWNGTQITIPVRDTEGHIIFFRLARDPEAAGPKMISTSGGHAALYGAEIFRTASHRVVISEGEFDRLVLESYGFPAVASTGGARAFPKRWAEDFLAVPEVYVCFARSREAAKRVARLIPQARVVTLPAEIGRRGDLSKYFTRLSRSAADFELLLREAKALPEERPS